MHVRPALLSWDVRPSSLLKPLSGVPLALVGLFVLFAGAAYCLGYESLLRGGHPWGPSLLWSAYGVWPWLAVFEWFKRRDGGHRPASAQQLATAFAAAAALSISLEILNDLISGDLLAPPGLMLLRRLPPAAVSLLLILLARRERGTRRPCARIAEAADSGELAVDPSLIRWVSAADNYVELHLAQRTILHRMTLTEAETLLRPLGFLRVHRSYLVNRAEVARVRAGKRPSLEMNGGARVPVGRAFAAALRQFQGPFATSSQSA